MSSFILAEKTVLHYLNIYVVDYTPDALREVSEMPCHVYEKCKSDARICDPSPADFDQPIIIQCRPGDIHNLHNHYIHI